jgi:hypothetical protein
MGYLVKKVEYMGLVVWLRNLTLVLPVAIVTAVAMREYALYLERLRPVRCRALSRRSQASERDTLRYLCDVGRSGPICRFRSLNS